MHSIDLTIGGTVLKVSVDLDIIIIKKGRQSKVRRERYTAYQPEDPSTTMPTHKNKGKKEKT